MHVISLTCNLPSTYLSHFFLYSQSTYTLPHTIGSRSIIPCTLYSYKPELYKWQNHAAFYLECHTCLSIFPVKCYSHCFHVEFISSKIRVIDLLCCSNKLFIRKHRSVYDFDIWRRRNHFVLWFLAGMTLVTWATYMRSREKQDGGSRRTCLR